MPLNVFSYFMLNMNSLIVTANQVEKSIQVFGLLIVLVECFHRFYHFGDISNDNGKCTVAYQENQGAHNALKVVLWREITEANS